MSSIQSWIAALLLTTVTHGVTDNTSICQNYKTLSDPWRNIGFKSVCGGPPKDLNLMPGWYRFTGVGGDRLVNYCPSNSSTTPKYLINNSSSTQLQLYSCDALYGSTGIDCAQANISTVYCDDGVILYNLSPTNGLYASRHSSCSNSSCGEYAQCGFLFGSCECNPGLSVPDGVLSQGSTYGCTDLPIKPSPECQGDSSVKCVEILLSQIQNSTVIPPVVITHTLDMLMNSTVVLINTSINDTLLVSYGNAVLNATEKLVSALVVKTNTSYYTSISLPSIKAAVFVFGPNSSVMDIPSLNTSTAYLDIDFTKLSNGNTGIEAVIFMSYTNMSSILKPDFFNTSSSAKKTMMSTVLTLKFLYNSNQEHSRQKRFDDSEPFNVTVEHAPVITDGSMFHCVNWRDVEWVEGNCKHIRINNSHSKCFCVHPGTFALIMQASGSIKDNRSLYMLNTVAVSVGLFFLFLALLTFAVCQRNPKVINAALINLCISLFLAHLLFLLTQTFLLDIASDVLLCAVLAGVEHFLFLSAFVWMSIEAVLLFIVVKNLTQIRPKMEMLSWKCLTVIGYVIPLTVVGVSIGLVPEGYGSSQCWLKTTQGFLWSFLGPVCVILALNLIIFISIGFLMVSTLRKLNNEVLQTKLTQSDNDLIKSVMLKVLLQFVIIGCSWILGFFTDSSDVMMILFLIFNSQQGTFIFFIHCVLNHEIRQQYKKFLSCSCFSSKSAPKTSGK
ncbi:adhesion G protein-coupled receptor E3-like [Pygocentrus nattereri]|uniref:Uncharacterized protein n=1 Tax=Pygocentrus nattereri TaxID=42514 RepID=A0A3B4BPQ4_PYGNA|nr:adhesion G protein-coupled receptor E3-like [Pygocentrus nattereri]